MVRRGIEFILVVLAAGAFGDAITVGNRAYEDVYVKRDRNHYFIHLPDEGRVIKVSRKRQDVSSPVIEEDPALREELLRRFEANKPESPDQPTVDLHSPLSNAAVNEHHRVRELALFEAQLAHWKSLSQEQRLAVDRMLLSNAMGEIGDFMTSANAMGGDTSVLESKIAAIAEKYTPGTPGAKGTSIPPTSTVSGARSATPNAASVRRTQGDALALTGRAVEGTKRVVLLKKRIDELSTAINGDYRDRLTPKVVDSWEGAGSLKTAPFSIEDPFWRLDCLRDDFGQAGAFSVTVYDADTDRPFTRLGDVDFLQMRVRVLDGPGRYYLKIEQDDSGTPYEIRAVTFAD